MDPGAPLGELFAERRVGVGEAGLQLLDPEQQPAEPVVAGFGGVGGGEGGGDGLGEQRGLGGELGGGLTGAQLPAADGQGGAGAVEQPEYVGEAVQDRGAGGGVGEVEGADQFRDGLQGLALLAEPLRQWPGLGGGGDGRAVLGQFRGPVPVRLEGGGFGELDHRPGGGLGQPGGEVFGECVDPLPVHPRQVAQRLDPALGAAQCGQPIDPFGGVGEGLAARGAQQALDVFCGLFGAGRGVRGELGDRLVLGDDLSGGLADLGERRGEVAEAVLAEPVVPVGGAGAGGEYGPVPGRGVGAGRGQPGQGQAVGEAADQVGVADPGQRAAAGRLLGGVAFAGERAPPQLDGVQPGGAVLGRAQSDQGAVVEQRVALAGERGGGLLADGVVRLEQRVPVDGGAELVQHVLAVGGEEGALVHQAVHRLVEDAHGAVGEVAAAGEGHALVGGQP